MNVNGVVEEAHWRLGLYDCCSGWGSPLVCLQGWFLPCWQFEDTGNVLLSSGCCWPCCLCCHFPCCGAVYAANTRRQIRLEYGIMEGPNSNKYAWTCCSCCATCQEAKELHAHAARNSLAIIGVDQPISKTAPGPQTMDFKPAAVASWTVDICQRQAVKAAPWCLAPLPTITPLL